MMDDVILVDTEDNAIGRMEKMEAHVTGALHRAFSVFIFNSKGTLLMQQRAHDKYHSAGQWTNTCCSHPKVGENTLDAANRRLMEEMGMVCKLAFEFSFVYQAEMPEGITENEFDHVFFGISDELPTPNPEEVAQYKYVEMHELEADIVANPDIYTAWVKICFDRVMCSYNKFF